MSDNLPVGKIEFAPGTVRTRLEALKLLIESDAELKAEFQRKHDAEQHELWLHSDGPRIAQLEAALKATVVGLQKIAEHQEGWQADAALEALYNMAVALDAPPPAPRTQ